MADERIEGAARLLAALRLRRDGQDHPIDEIPDHYRPASLGDAYRVQAALSERLAACGAGPPVGWKIGCTTPVMQAYLGIPHPCAGRLHAASVHGPEVTLSGAAYHRLGLECEVAVRLVRAIGAIDAIGGVHTANTVAGSVGTVMASIEIVEHRFRDFESASVPSLVADDFFSAGCVHGRERPIGSVGDLGALRGGFALNGEPPLETGPGSAILGHPLNALAWLANHAAGQGARLEAGDLVTLGSVVKTIYPVPGTRVEARFDGLDPAVVHVAR